VRDTDVTRRRLLTGGAAVLGGATLGGLAVAATRQDEVVADEQPWGGDTLPFRGAHQAGIETPQQAHAWFVALDLVPGADRDAAARLLALWTDDIERLMSGRGALADQERELAAVPARLSVTVGVGASLFTRLGLEAQRPPSLRPLPAFRTDRLDEAWGEADLLLQVAADDVLAVSHAVRVLTRDVRSIAAVRWVQRGFTRARGSVADGTTPRNLLGQVDGTVNPAPGTDDFARVVWSHEGPAWWHGGTMLVLRRIRMDLDGWEKLGRTDRELVVGRRLADGSPLTGGLEQDPVDLDAVDADGLPVVPEAAHVRAARALSPDERFLRRGYTYDDTATTAGDAGLLFCALMADVDRQFLPVQRRLAEADLLNAWTTAVGSAVFALLPGSAPGERLGADLPL
jgi:dye decolorizing peroxidase